MMWHRVCSVKFVALYVKHFMCIVEFSNAGPICITICNAFLSNFPMRHQYALIFGTLEHLGLGALGPTQGTQLTLSKRIELIYRISLVSDLRFILLDNYSASRWIISCLMSIHTLSLRIFIKP